MLDAMRRNAKSWVVRVLLLFLILSFAVWGVGDVFLGSRGEIVATVGDSEITTREVSAGFRAQADQMRQQFGSEFGRAQAANFGLVQSALQGLIVRRSVDEHAKSLGYRPSDDQIAAMLGSDPTFLTGGVFDRDRFTLFLRSNGLTEEDFVERLKSDAARGEMVRLVTEQARPPSALAERLAAHQGETRSGALLVLPIDALELPNGPPDDAVLAAHLEANQADFQTRERRDVVFVTLEAGDIADEILVDDAMIEADYQARIAAFTTPRAVIFEQIRGEEAELGAIADQLASAEVESLEAAAAAVGADIAVERFEDRAFDELPSAFADAIESAAAGAAPAPFETAFGWHLIDLVEDRAARAQPLEEVRASIEQRLRAERAQEQLPELATALDDELGGGATLEEAADALGLAVETLAGVDRNGADGEGERAASDRIAPDMLGAAFASGVVVDETSFLEETDAGAQFVFRVDRIEAPRAQSLEEAREALVEAVEADRQIAAAQEAITAIAERLSEGATVDGALQGRDDVIRERFDAMTRDGRAGDDVLGPTLAEAVFAQEEGRWSAEPLDHPRGPALALVETIVPGAVADGVAEALRQAMQDDLLSQYEAALRSRFPADIDANVLAALIEFEAGGQQLP